MKLIKIFCLLLLSHNCRLISVCFSVQLLSQETNTGSKSTIETLEKYVKYVQSFQGWQLNELNDVVLVSLLLTLSIFRIFSIGSIVDFEQVNICWNQHIGNMCINEHKLKYQNFNWEKILFVIKTLELLIHILLCAACWYSSCKIFILHVFSFIMLCFFWTNIEYCQPL